MYKVLKLAAALLLAGAAAGCGGSGGDTAAPAPHPAKTQKNTITMMYPLELEHFRKLVSDTYPDIVLEAELTTAATINGDSERRLRNAHGTDLVVTTLPTGDVKEYVSDLSSTDFVSRYQAAVLSSTMVEGQTRLLPLPGQYSGYILNKTQAEELGYSSISDNEQLLALLAAGKEKNIGIGEDGNSFGLLSVDTAAFGSYVVGAQVPDFLGTAEGIRWLAAFEDKTGSFAGAWEDCMDLLLQMVEGGYLSPATISLTSSNALPIRERMLSGTLLISYGNLKLLTELNEMSDTYEYIMLPFQSGEGNPAWLTASPDAYIGVNRALETEDPDKLEACRKVLSLLSTQEGQEAWMADTMATTSYLNNCTLSRDLVPEELQDCVSGGYVYNLRMPDNIIRYFGECMIQVLSGKEEMPEALAKVDDYYLNGSRAVDYDQSVVGSVSEDLIYENYNTRQEETAIGNLVADAAAEYLGADIGVVNGGGIRASLYKGDVRGGDLAAVCPYDNPLVLIELSGKTIREMLENGISQLVREANVPAGRFLQVSGLRYTFRPPTDSSPAELLSVTLTDGSALDPEGRYTMAVTSYMAGASGYLDNNGDGFTMLNLYSDTAPLSSDVKLLQETDVTYADVLRAYFANHQDEEITAGTEGRITIENRRD